MHIDIKWYSTHWLIDRHFVLFDTEICQKSSLHFVTFPQVFKNGDSIFFVQSNCKLPMISPWQPWRYDQQIRIGKWVLFTRPCMLCNPAFIIRIEIKHRFIRCITIQLGFMAWYKGLINPSFSWMSTNQWVRRNLIMSVRFSKHN